MLRTQSQGPGIPTLQRDLSGIPTPLRNFRSSTPPRNLRNCTTVLGHAQTTCQAQTSTVVQTTPRRRPQQEPSEPVPLLPLPTPVTPAPAYGNLPAAMTPVLAC